MLFFEAMLRENSRSISCGHYQETSPKYGRIKITHQAQRMEKKNKKDYTEDTYRGHRTLLSINMFTARRSNL